MTGVLKIKVHSKSRKSQPSCETLKYNFHLPIDLYLLKLKDLQLNARLHSFEQDSTSRELKMSRTRNEKNLYPLLSRVKQSRNKHGNYAKSISIDMCLLLPRVYQLKLSLMIIFFLGSYQYRKSSFRSRPCIVSNTNFPRLALEAFQKLCIFQE